MGNTSTPVSDASYDVVGRYRQDEVNGFSEQLLDRMAELVDPAHATAVLDAMAGDGNLTSRLCAYCKRHGIPVPRLTVLEYSRVQCEFARKQLEGVGAQILWGDALTMACRKTGEPLPEHSFDRVMTKSANHEIPRDRQLQLYESVYRILSAGGYFVNLGFLFDDPEERDELARCARVKDTLAGMKAAVVDRYFLTREEFYDRLKQAGFVDVRCAEACTYTIRSEMVAEQYFSQDKREEADLKHQAAQVMARTMRRNRKIRFEEDRSVMLCPGEITLARRPTWAESNDRIFRDCPYGFLRHLEAHAEMLSEAVESILADAHVLDIGCGPGLLAERLVEKCARYRGIDISREFVQSCRDRMGQAPSFSFETADMGVIDFGNSCYDVVAILNALNLPGVDAIKVLRKALGALKKGGRLIVSGPISAESFSRAEPMMRAQLERDGLLDRYGAAFQAVVEANRKLLTERANYWSPEGMVELLKRLGFDRVRSVNTQIYYGFSYMVVAEK
jgi:SAM-dependent methyltransferase